MKHARPSSLFPLCAVAIGGALLLSGCGGGGGNGNSSGGVGTTGSAGTTGGSGTGGTSTPTLIPAETGLNALVRSTQPLTVTNLSATATQFDQARQAAPTSKDAQLGYAISEAALASSQFANLVSAGAVPSIKAGNPHALAPSVRTAQIAQALVLWRLPQLLSASGGTTWPQVTDFLPTAAVTAHIAGKRTISPVQAQADITALDASLVNVEGALAIAGADSTYTYTLADPSQPANTAATVKIGIAEIRILSAAVSAVRSLTNLSLAYNADPGTFDFNAVIPQTDFTGSALSTAQYLPASPFLTLNADGAGRMATVGSELNNVAVSGIAAIEDVKTRSNSGYLLNPGTLVSTGQLNSAETQIKTVQSYLTGTETITLSMNGQQIPTQISLFAFLSHPPADLKALLPSFTISSSSSDTYVTRAGFPDPTFGGLFPSGLPIDQGAAAANQYYVVSGGAYDSPTYASLISAELGGL